MNSLTNKEWEIYQIDSIIKSTEYDNILVNKNIENYFNKLINKPTSPPQYKIINKSNYTFEKFYYEYIEHNLLFIVLLVGIIIFIIIRYFSNDHNFETFEEEKIDNDVITVNENLFKKKQIDKYDEKINKLKKIKKLQQIQLLKYKKELDNEKQKILSIIDELSSINDNNYEKKSNDQIYLNNDINLNYANNYVQSQNFLNQINDNSNLPHNSYEDTEYYDFSKKNNNDDELNSIDGLYIEPPFN